MSPPLKDGSEANPPGPTYNACGGYILPFIALAVLDPLRGNPAGRRPPFGVEFPGDVPSFTELETVSGTSSALDTTFEFR